MIFPGDVIISEAISQGLEDLRKNPWLLDDIFSPFVKEPTLASKYGQKEIDLARDWFLNNKIEVNLRYRNDKDQFPCVTIALGSSTEKDEMKHLGDLSTEIETLMPNQIGKPIPYVVKPFVPDSYNTVTGLLSVPGSVDLRLVQKNQILVDPDSGVGYIIQDVISEGIVLEPELELTLSRAGVVPQFQFYRARREHTFFQETYTIGCHVHGDPSTLLWLHAIVLYTLLRYRESLLEARCFTQSSFSSTDMVPNSNFEGPAGDNVFTRSIIITGQVENSWLKTPYRVIESVVLEDQNEEGIKAGIKICSNLDSPDSLNTPNDLWTTIKIEEED